MKSIDLKWCTNCKARHPRNAFGRDRTRGDGLRTVCRVSRATTRRTAAERFFAKTDRSPSGCLLWTGSTYPSGYGNFWYEGRIQGAHRVAWMLAEGPITESDCILHQCDVRLCIERSHLFLGDRHDNAADMTGKGRRASQPGEANARAKLTWVQVDEIRRLRGLKSQRVLAEMFGVSKARIRQIQQGRAWSEGPHRFPGVNQNLTLRPISASRMAAS